MNGVFSLSFFSLFIILRFPELCRQDTRWVTTCWIWWPCATAPRLEWSPWGTSSLSSFALSAWTVSFPTSSNQFSHLNENNIIAPDWQKAFRGNECVLGLNSMERTEILCLFNNRNLQPAVGWAFNDPSEIGGKSFPDIFEKELLTKLNEGQFSHPQCLWRYIWFPITNYLPFVLNLQWMYLYMYSWSTGATRLFLMNLRSAVFSSTSVSRSSSCASFLSHPVL